MNTAKYHDPIVILQSSNDSGNPEHELCLHKHDGNYFDIYVESPEGAPAVDNITEDVLVDALFGTLRHILSEHAADEKSYHEMTERMQHLFDFYILGKHADEDTLFEDEE